MFTVGLGLQLDAIFQFKYELLGNSQFIAIDRQKLRFADVLFLEICTWIVLDEVWKI
jgi:hypothetical protein